MDDTLRDLGDAWVLLFLRELFYFRKSFVIMTSYRVLS